jgi:hypothetical protein
VIRFWEHAFANPGRIVQKIRKKLGNAKCGVGADVRRRKLEERDESRKRHSPVTSAATGGVRCA